MSSFLKVSIRLNPIEPWGTVLNQDLADIGFEAFEDMNEGFHAFISKDDFQLEAFENVIATYSDRTQISTDIEEIEKVNWNKEWETNYEVIKITDKILLRASFHPSDPSFEYQIQITPKMSFGTGHHATTQLMLREMLTLDLTEKNVLDVGCGTGVLSIFSELKGAKSIRAIDIDQWAIDNSRENIHINNCQFISVEKGKVNDVGENAYNVILANINFNVIKNDFETYCNLLDQKGEILLSGFLKEQITDIENLGSRFGLSLENQRVIGDWAMLRFLAL